MIHSDITNYFLQLSPSYLLRKSMQNMGGLLYSIRYFKTTVYCDIAKISYIRESPGRLIWQKTLDLSTACLYIPAYNSVTR